MVILEYSSFLDMTPKHTAEKKIINLRILKSKTLMPKLGFPNKLRWQRIHLQCRRLWFSSWVGKILWSRDRLPTPIFLSYLCGSAGKESTCNTGDLGLIPGLGRSPGEGKGYPLQYSSLENPRAVQSMGSQRVRHDWAVFTFML